MKATIFFGLLISAILTTGCVDSDYDLSKVTTGDITIGDEDTVLEIPIATITLTASDLDGTRTKGASGAKLTLDEILSLGNAFMPSGEDIDIAKLTSDTGTESKDYTSELVNKLITELKTSESKREDLAKELMNNEALIDQEVYTAFGITDLSSYDSYADLAEVINTAVSSVNEADIQKTADAISDNTYLDIHDALKEYSEIDSTIAITDIIEIPSEVETMMENNNLTPVLKWSTNMPFKISLDKLHLQGGGKDIDFMDDNADFSISDVKTLLGSGNAKVNYKASLSEYRAESMALKDGTLTVVASIKSTGRLTFE